MRQQILSSSITLLLFFILLFGYTKLAGPIPFNITSVTTTKSTTFDVSATGKAQIQPDTATIQAGVTAKGDTTQDVQNQINSTISKISDAVKALGIDSKDIQTSNYNINPNYDYSGGTQKQNGYSANTSLNIKVRDTSKIGQVIDTATSAGATNVNNLGLTSSDQVAAENEARKQAVDLAKQKAQTAAQTAGFTLGRIVNYSETEAPSPRPVPLMEAQGSTVQTPTPIEVGSNEVQITVTLSYEIK